MSEQGIDVLIVGGGGAACRAAIAAADSGARVALMVKGRLGKCGATAFKAAEMAGFNVADGQVDPADSPQAHFDDIMIAANGMADASLAKIVAEEAPLALSSLESWGVPFERVGGKYLEFQSCFSSRARTHVIKGHGEPIMRALIAELNKRGVIVYEDSLVTNLFVHNGECLGVGILDNLGHYRAVAGVVVLATGGAGQLFGRNLNPPDICGDGYFLAHTAGAELINMEFMQAGIGFSHPLVSLFMAWLWAAYPSLKNRIGKAFLPDYLPQGITTQEVMDAHAGHFPFSSSDTSRYIEIAVQTELVEGRGTPEHGVYLDLCHVTPDYLQLLPAQSALRKMWPITEEYLRRRGVDVGRQSAQIACFAHAINGGVRIDSQGATKLRGLYAAGEVAGGPHGANRLGGNMMVTCQVFGARAGAAAAKSVRSTRGKNIPTELVSQKQKELQAECGKRINVQELKSRLQGAADLALLVRRHQKGLDYFLDVVAEIQNDIDRSPIDANHCRPEVWELRSLLQTGRIMARAAQFRQESRGSHFRTDFPQRDDEHFGKPLLIREEAMNLLHWPLKRNWK